MDGDSETLKQQFQLLQEQQQRKLQRRKQRKEEKEREKSSVTGEQTPTFGVNDNLDLKLADPVPKSNSYLSEELVDHLNHQIRELKDENGRVYKLLSEKDFELRNIKKKMEQEKAAPSGLTNETAATRIVELSKKIRELTAEMESEKTRSKQYAMKCQELKNKLGSIPEDARTLLGSAISLKSLQEDKPENEGEIKALQDKLRQTEAKLADFRNQAANLKQDLKIAHKVLSQEVGDNVNIQSLLNSSNSNWRGRAEQISMLQRKVEELKSQLAPPSRGETDLESEMMGSASSRRRTADERYREQLRKQERERKEAQERQLAEMKALEQDYEELKKKLDAAKTRNKVLSNEVKPLKQQIQTLLQKGQHDDELIQALMDQQAKLTALLDSKKVSEKEQSKENEAKLKIMAMKSQQDSNVVEQLKAIVAEKEAKVQKLEDDLKQLKINHIQKAQMDGVNQIFKKSDNRPESSILSSRPTTAADNVDVGFVLSSDTPTLSRMSDRPPTMMTDRSGTITDRTLTDRPNSKSGARLSSRPSSRKQMKTPVNAGNNPQLSELQYQCQELNTVLQASEVEREKLSELVKVLQARLNENMTMVSDLQNDLVIQKRKCALMEKQVGKSKVEQQNQLIKSSSAAPKSSRKPGGKGLTSSISGNPLTSSMTANEIGGLLEDESIENMNVEELRANLEIQQDENKALKAALSRTLAAKEEDLHMYYNTMEETKKVFVQAMRQFKNSIQLT